MMRHGAGRDEGPARAGGKVGGEGRDGVRGPQAAFRPGRTWLDSGGRPIEAHQGCVLFDRGTYYWYGADFSGPHLPLAPPRMFSWYYARGTNVYSSSDLYNWKREGVALANVDDPAHPLYRLNHVARPKVVRSDATGKYVLMGTLLSPDVNRGDTHRYPVVAVADTPVGPFEYLGQLPWPGHDTREVLGPDIALVKDEAGKAYLVSGWGPVWVYELADDCLSIVRGQRLEGVRGEAPAVFRHEVLWYMAVSELTGWAANPNTYATAESLLGPWTDRGRFCVGDESDPTFGGQTCFVLPVAGRDGAFIYVADRFNAASEFVVDDFRKATHIWLPVQFGPGRGTMRVTWHEEWDLSFFDGR